MRLLESADASNAAAAAAAAENCSNKLTASSSLQPAVAGLAPGHLLGKPESTVAWHCCHLSSECQVVRKPQDEGLPLLAAESGPAGLLCCSACHAVLAAEPPAG